MLSKAHTEYLCRVGPGTPMGNLFRQYWLPAIKSDELPERDGAPLRVRLLGEDLMGFRTATTIGRCQPAARRELVGRDRGAAHALYRQHQRRHGAGR